MTFAQSIRHCLSHYATFSGRASRSEYWWFTLFVSLVAGSLVGLGFVPLSAMEPGGEPPMLAWVFFGLSGIFVLGMLMPMWAVAVRRFHDRDLSGWVYLGLALAGMIPWVGFLATIASFVITVLRGKPGPNRFGPDPLNPSSADVFA